jgi:hypothetical protein
MKIERKYYFKYEKLLKNYLINNKSMPDITIKYTEM